MFCNVNKMGVVAPFRSALFCCMCWMFLGGCVSQDCTGVTCPILNNCIEEVLEAGACCATCVQLGCRCEGYQYYDCVNAGFRNGKVKAGDSYFVDFGSTECMCPQDGGRIECHFIPCPDIPPNCIEVSTPADGCAECDRLGCLLDEHKYEAGHTFHIDTCQVCHCPNDGGTLMCYTVPDCDPQSTKKPVLALPTVDNALDSKSSRSSERSNVLPPFNEEQLQTTKEDEVEYDYPPTDMFFPTEQSTLLARPHETPMPPVRLEEGAKQELRERVRSREPEMESEETTDDPQTEEPSPAYLEEDTTPEPQALEGQTQEGEADLSEELPNKEEYSDLGISTMDPGVTKDHQLEISMPGEQTTDHSDPTTEMDTIPSDKYDETSVPQPVQVLTSNLNSSNPQTDAHVKSSTPKQEETNQEDTSITFSEEDEHVGTTVSQFSRGLTTEPTEPSQAPDITTAPAGKSSPTRQPPDQAEAEEEQPLAMPTDTMHSHLFQEETHQNVIEPLSQHEEEVSVLGLVERCCKAGQNWAATHPQCTGMRYEGEDGSSICRTAQMQCCLGFVKESRCLEGINTAKAGDTCEAQGADSCMEDTYKECCSCCSLGLRFRASGQSCEAHQYLSYPCGHVFLTCCEDEDTSATGQPPLRSRERPRASVPPNRVVDRHLPNEAFSISDADRAANSVEEPEDMDECQLYPGQLCHHTCINTWGSYECACFQGFTLLQDGHICVPESSVEDNALQPDGQLGTEAPVTVTSTSQPAVPHNPCQGNGSCMQLCLVEDGRPRCSCFPGFALATDRQACEDVNECVTNTHTCQAGERCVNTVGFFVCETRLTCPAGYQARELVCEDVDECALRTHTCGPGSECHNTEGSFTCSPRQRCFTGFTQDSHGNCVDVNECASLEEPCSSGFNCINTVGSYTCQRKVILCSQGYHSSEDGARCMDVDECQTGAHRCGEGQICHNLPGTYRCDCQTGYQYDMIRRVCVDVNECWRYPGRLCAQTCDNSPGSYRCSCTTGFNLASDGKNCEDVNECNNNPCNQECANIYGSYQCYCRQGFYLKEDGHTCEDIDECSQSIGHLCAFQCVNVPGSYQCACPTHGYSMSPNGRTCRDIDECAIGSHNCSTSQTCYNIQGSFRCTSFNCPANYRKVSDTRCERISCSNILDCQNIPLRITYYQLSFQTNIIIPAQIFRIGPSPAYSGDNIIISITSGNEENYFSTRKLNSFTGAVYLHRQVREPRDFLIDVEMKLLRQGTFTTFLARMYVFITAHTL